MHLMNVTISAGVAPDVDQIGTHVPVPGVGVLPVNAFVVHARRPLLIDAGVVGLADETLAAVRQTIDLEQLEYVYLTHTDPDHVGCLRQLLAEAPRAKLVTTFLGMGKLGLTEPVAGERVSIVNPGEQLDLGDRRLLVGKPITYDAPETTWLRELDSDILFSSDCFGAVLPRPFRTAASIPHEQLRDGLVAWTGIDSPWFFTQDRDSLGERMSALRPPRSVLSAHLPPAHEMGEHLLDLLNLASGVRPAAPPDQAALEALLASA